MLARNIPSLMQTFVHEATHKFARTRDHHYYPDNQDFLDAVQRARAFVLEKRQLIGTGTRTTWLGRRADLTEDEETVDLMRSRQPAVYDALNSTRALNYADVFANYVRWCPLAQL